MSKSPQGKIPVQLDKDGNLNPDLGLMNLTQA